MRIDLYTRVVLTVIAVCLVWLSVGGPSLLTPVAAQNTGYERVAIVGWVDAAGLEHGLQTVSRGPTPGLPMEARNPR